MRAIKHLADLTRAFRREEAWYIEQLRPFGIAPGELVLLHTIAVFTPGTSNSVIANSLNVSLTYVSLASRKLMHRGWITITKSPTDKRASVLEVTAQGARLLRDIDKLLTTEGRK